MSERPRCIFNVLGQKKKTTHRKPEVAAASGVNTYSLTRSLVRMDGQGKGVKEEEEEEWRR